jgi:hypothetical protein
MVRRKTIGLRRSARAADSVGGIQNAALNARSNRRRAEGDASRMCATHRTPKDRAERHLVPRSRTRRFTIWIHRPSVVRLDAVGDVPAALRFAGRVECCYRLA